MRLSRDLRVENCYQKILYKRPRYVRFKGSPHLRGPVVMVTHHAPSYKSVAPEFLHTGTVGAYASDLNLLCTSTTISLLVSRTRPRYQRLYGQQYCVIATLVVISRRTELTVTLTQTSPSQYDSVLNLINRHFLPGVPDRTL